MCVLLLLADIKAYPVLAELEYNCPNFSYIKIHPESRNKFVYQLYTNVFVNRCVEMERRWWLMRWGKIKGA